MAPSPRRLMVALLAPLVFLYHLLSRIFWSGLNDRNVLTLPLNFGINFSPVFVWLLIFKNAGLIPKNIRPPIHVALAHHLDTFMFSVIKSPLGCLLTLALTTAFAWWINLRWYQPQQKPSFTPLSSCSADSDLEMSSLDGSIEDSPKDFYQENITAPADFQDHPRIGSLEFIPAMSQFEVSENTATINKKILQSISSPSGYRPYNCWVWVPPALLASSWWLLNFDHWMSQPITVPKDMVSWFSYVIGHFCVPLFTAIWLYVFHAPGALRLFSFALGAQNIAGVITHLLFPNAPPWFITLNGDNGVASYDTEGYAAGLIRAPFGTGTHLVTQGFHKSPIVFGALPSLHSAMAVMCFFFVAYYSRWTIAKLGLFFFVVLQWWATIYLDHHWRLDLIAGMLYALALFTVFFRWRMHRVDEDFINARLRYDFVNGSTMGMRVFRNTKLQNFFDPLS
ncbi:CIC11C00000005133 [Sungouiella intermedia]|uniref:CIC11C00000005133 n=1 Tax=Sungouiella intermedia TaxID=45354 RepID=A0A1L0BDK0_9ASCO|nr:CIC11C00000005133 [[Candida] intermedia]